MTTQRIRDDFQKLEHELEEADEYISDLEKDLAIRIEEITELPMMQAVEDIKAMLLTREGEIITPQLAEERARNIVAALTGTMIV